jgi:hypothetical protein
MYNNEPIVARVENRCTSEMETRVVVKRERKVKTIGSE